ncbi:glycoside hydrolase superfamily [Cadophora sp. MPI-SDFR-AT-0126]|nr:glycoside hydrolase superfamily [Leotiomycetes sp. MPI-SDFR-AT-0126]
MSRAVFGLFLSLLLLLSVQNAQAHTIKLPRREETASPGRERISINRGWRFSRFTSNPDSLSYNTLKPWILPSGNDFIINGTKTERPAEESPGGNVTYVQASFDDGGWESVDLPHDWAIKGPFNAPGISGGMGRLPSNGVGWYRRKLAIASDDQGKSIFLDIDGAMSYAAVWLNGKLVGGWPFGYASFRLDLTPYLTAGEENVLAIRLENAVDSSRWYPGAGIYRNVWLVKVDPVHVGQFGTYITTPSVNAEVAVVNLAVDIENKGSKSREVGVVTEIRELDTATEQAGASVVAVFERIAATVAAGTRQTVKGSVTIQSPRLWGPPPAQQPYMYVAVTTVSADGATIDTYETPFGIRAVTYDKDNGVLVNGQAIRIQGTCNHHDLGSIGAAFNTRAAERQLQSLQEMGANALRTSHNPPAPEFLELADRLGFLVMAEIFDCWLQPKTTNDFHLIFQDWHEPDLRAFLRRDRNHPSIISWSFGNEIPEQQTAAGNAIAQELQAIIRAEEPTRPTTSGMDRSRETDPLPKVLDIIGLNYQGEGRGTSNTSLYPAFRTQFPEKMIWGSETASTVSTRDQYVFPVTPEWVAIIGNDSGGNYSAMYASSYDLYAPVWATSADKVFAQQDRYPYVAGEFVWTGHDYIGEPTPFDGRARSSYFGIVDLAGFKKDRFYLYQARWNPNVPMAHILPHWNWPERVGQITPVHVYSSADEAELFVNGESAGRVTKGPSSYRFRWDAVTYTPGDLKVVTYKDGKEWAVGTKRTAGDAVKLKLTADRTTIRGDGLDLSFLTVTVVDSQGDTVPRATNAITFSLSGPGEIVSTDNGDQTDMASFPSLTRNTLGGLALAIVRFTPGASGEITISATSPGLAGGSVALQVQ